MKYHKLTIEELIEEYNRCIESGRLHLSMGDLDKAAKYSTLSVLAFEEIQSRDESVFFQEKDIIMN